MEKSSNLSEQLGISSHTVLTTEKEKELVKEYILTFFRTNPLDSCIELVYQLSKEASKNGPLQSRDYITKKCNSVLQQIKKDELYESSRL